MFHLFQPASFYQFINFSSIQTKKNKQIQIMQDVFILGLPDSLRWFIEGFFQRVRQFPASPLIIFEMKLLLHLPVIANNATFSTMPNAMPARPYSPLEFLQNRGLPTPLKNFFNVGLSNSQPFGPQYSQQQSVLDFYLLTVAFLDLKMFFFDPEKVKKRASKVAHNRPRPFYFTVQPRPQPTAQN